MLSKIRKTMGKANGKMDALKYIVECDEVYIGGKPRRKNCKWIANEPKEKIPVVVLVERPAAGRPGNARAFAMTEKDHKGRLLSQETMTALVEKHVDLDVSELHSDESLYCKGLDDRVFHQSVLHNRRYVSADGHVHCNTGESFNAIIKRMHYGIYHKMEHVQSYADEESYRWSHRHDEPVFALERIMRLALNPAV